MKNFIIITCLVFMAQVCNAQFVYTPDNFRADNDPGKDYVVLSIPNSLAKDNFKKIKYIFSKEIFSTKTANTDDSLYIFGLQEAAHLAGVKPLTDMFYSVSISCRDSLVKVQFNLRYFQSWHGVLGGGMTVMGSGLVYKKGKIKNETAKSEAEKFANNFTRDLESKLRSGGDNW